MDSGLLQALMSLISPPNPQQAGSQLGMFPKGDKTPLTGTPMDPMAMIKAIMGLLGAPGGILQGGAGDSGAQKAAQQQTPTGQGMQAANSIMSDPTSALINYLYQRQGR